jgi:hypothetical protein
MYSAPARMDWMAFYIDERLREGARAYRALAAWVFRLDRPASEMRGLNEKMK